MTPERTGVAAGDHGWAKYSSTAMSGVGSAANASDLLTEFGFDYWFGYYFSNGQPSGGQFEVVLRTFVVGAFSVENLVDVRYYRVGVELRFRLWDVTNDVQLGGDSGIFAGGFVRRLCLRHGRAGKTLDFFVDGVLAISTTHGQGVAIFPEMQCGLASVGTERFWSAWMSFMSDTDDLDESMYPEMRLLNPDGQGTYNDYLGVPEAVDKWKNWDDFAAEGDVDDGAGQNEGQNFGNQRQTSHLSTRTMVNGIRGVGWLGWLRANSVTKFVVHGAMLRTSVDSVLSFGSVTLPETFAHRTARWHTKPGGGAWGQADVDALQAGHRRDADGLIIFVSSLGVVVVGLGATDVAPPAPLGLGPPLVVAGRRSDIVGGRPLAPWRPSRPSMPRGPRPAARPRRPVRR
jgi:hypothetical protein